MFEIILYVIALIWFKKFKQPKIMLRYKNDSQKYYSYSKADERELCKLINITLISLAIQVIINITIKDNTILWLILLILNMTILFVATINNPVIKQHRRHR